MHRRFLAVLAFMAVAWPAWALDPPYLSEWPDVDRVLADVHGDNSQDTMARQMAALHILQTSIEEMAGPRRWHGLTPDEESLRGQYNRGAESIREAVNSTLSNELGPGVHGPFAKPPLREWYASDPAFRAAVLQRYLSPPLLATLGAQAHATPDSNSTRAGPSGRPWPTYLAGLAGILVLVVVVRGLRRRLAQRRAGRVDAATARLDADPGEVDSGKLSRLEKDRKAAAEEVLDSLEPYIIAAQNSGRLLPYKVLADAYVLAFLTTYCHAGFAAVTGSEVDKVDSTEKIEVLKQLLLLQGRGRRALFAGNFVEAMKALGEQPEAETSVKLSTGEVFASVVLKMFKGDASAAAELQGEVGDPVPEEMELADFLTPTRLHPDGPNAQTARRVLLVLLTKRLADLARENDGDD
jgi:hypothetical protein